VLRLRLNDKRLLYYYTKAISTNTRAKDERVLDGFGTKTFLISSHSSFQNEAIFGMIALASLNVFVTVCDS
jgi:hypothetical protein